MNTRKLIFGILACLVLMAASAAPYATTSDSNEDAKIEKRTLKPKDHK